VTERKITVSFGSGEPKPHGAQFSLITKVRELTWEKFAEALTKTPPVLENKAEAGWYCPAEFAPVYRDGDNLKFRHALTFDYDKVTPADIATVQRAFKNFAYAIYTTHSHTKLAPRVRVVLPLSRPATPDEFCAVSRKIAAEAGIELTAGESHVPAQMMFLPAVKPGAKFKGSINPGYWVDVDAALASYENWTDRTQWPHRKVGDGTYKPGELPEQPRDKQGIVGDFCRAFSIEEAIERFDLPYKPTATEGRWTYTAGSRPEGAIIYDEGQKLHSHHDSDPARGQHNAFDLVRLHRYAKLDDAETDSKPVTELPSFRAMVQLALDQREVRAAQATLEFDVLPPLTPAEEEEAAALRARRSKVPEARDGAGEAVSTGARDFAALAELHSPHSGDREREAVGVAAAPEGAESATVPAVRRVKFRVIPAHEFAVDVPLEWLVKSVLPKGGLAVLYGESGAGKSFAALDVACAIARGVPWRDLIVKKGRVTYVVAEGKAGFRQRVRAYAKYHELPLTELTLGIVADAPNLMEIDDALDLTKQILAAGGADLVIVDTLARAMPAGNENASEDMGRAIAHCQAIHGATGALVLLVHHSGKDTTKGARGWSGLRAAADAELEVTRNGDYRLLTTRKVKDGSDDREWGFRLNVVGLGMDSDGDEITSCVVAPVERREQPATREKPRGPEQTFTYEEALKLLAQGPMAIDDLAKAIGEMKPKTEEGRDRRKEYAAKTITKLVESRLLFLHDRDQISITSANAVASADWDDDAQAQT
jgi:hypothetical protein